MRKTKIIAMLVLIIISIMSVAYAIFATQLTINGETEIVGEWNIRITGIEVSEVSEGCDSGTPEFTDTTVTFNAKLEKPGDVITYVITVQNAGTIDAILNSVTFTPDNENGSLAIVYSTTNPSETLNSGEQTTFTVSVTYDENYTEVPEIKTKQIVGIIEYVQK